MIIWKSSLLAGITGVVLWVNAACLAPSLHAGVDAPVHLRCEGQEGPLGIYPRSPRLSWQLADTGSDVRQSAYQVVVAYSRENLDKGHFWWDSGKVISDQSVGVVYGGPEPEARQLYFWKVRVWDRSGNVSDWSEVATWETGLLGRGDWSARWITGHERDTAQSMPAVYYRTQFNIPPAGQEGDKVESARLYVSARGVFEGWINGQRVGEDYFAPGWTDYNIRNQYLTYDVTDALRKGENVLGFIVGDGWHNGYLMWGKHHRKNWYGEDTALLAQLVIRYQDGNEHIVATDENWLNRTGPIVSSDFYDGETYDARLELGNWSEPGYDAEGWWPCRLLQAPQVPMEAKRFGTVRQHETLKPVAVTRGEKGEWIYDFGQNMVGWVKLRVSGEEGDSVILRFAETLHPDGSLYTDNLRKAKVTDTYHFARAGTVEWEPHFTFHGFRYASVWAAHEPESVEAVVMHTQLQPAGSIETSNPLVNRLQQNIVWSLRSNFLEIPTDCPQRDERLGWTGDAQVFIRTAIYNRDVKNFFEKWLTDLRDAQGKDGQFPNIAPRLNQKSSAAGWGDAGVICPWAIYQFYGDRRVLEENYEAMKAWVDFQERSSDNLIRPESGFGDWLALDKEDSRGPGDTATPRALVATAFFAHAADLVARTAEVLENERDKQHYSDLHERVRTAFQKEFISQGGRVSGDTQTAYVLALGFGLVPERLRETASGYLVDDIRARDWHLSTGFIGTGLLMPVLNEIGRNDVAYRLLLQETYPGWLYSVRQGATTMWERWNSYSHENGFARGGMNSFNHYAYGAVGQWLYAVVGGISPLDPGFKSILIRPVPGGDLTWAKTHYDCPYGRIETDWKVEGDTFTLKAIVPPNTSAVVELPDGRRETVGSGVHNYTCTLPAASRG
ncbi:family 78 glycoside hydrolase catalytic domain [Ruficoccus amylovorans]|uniref:alpha-L-rhamnosidase n=1 Tax=Ruficoccus amylovorans TaxID=1804625 RepID=A0A842HB12_9BACT|nr:glycoside hydrolase family 78 protein [Ruficoccus amylovorans]MBC2593663.1 family 78 glycoside hydrolase catalytic domain [Ruficoccus amylovorans]